MISLPSRPQFPYWQYYRAEIEPLLSEVRPVTILGGGLGNKWQGMHPAAVMAIAAHSLGTGISDTGWHGSLMKK